MVAESVKIKGELGRASLAGISSGGAELCPTRIEIVQLPKLATHIRVPFVQTFGTNTTILRSTCTFGFQ